MITSTYPFDFGEYLEYSTPARLSRKRVLLSQVLKTYGYSTAFFHDNPYLSPIFGYDRGFDLVVDFGDKIQAISKVKWSVFSIFKNEKVRRLIWRTKDLILFLRWYFKNVPLHTDAETIFKEALSWIQTVNQPYFLWVHLMDTHIPYCSKHEILDKFGINKFQALRVVYKHFKQKELTSGELEIFKLLYDAQIYQIDLALSRYLPKIIEGNVKDNYVIITADHGEELEDKRKAGTHSGKLTDKLLRVPLIIYGGELTQKIVNIKASLVDLAPTILDLLRIEKPKYFRGISLLEKDKSRTVIAQGIFKGRKHQRVI
jgi:arylsulfatase A-like enzyme